MPDELKVELRQPHGKLENRRMRAVGKVPAVLYGHGQENVSLTVEADAFRLILRHGSRLVNLTGAVNDSAFIRELQWDTWGAHLLHIDFTRISLHEKVEIDVEIGLKGEAPGVREGGVVQQLVHHVKIDCPAGSIPDRLWVSINQLKLEDEIKVGALELPQGATLLDDPELIAVQCVVPAEAPEEEAGVSGPAEPEVIGGKKEEEGEEE